jgi:hypothetical protein
MDEFWTSLLTASFHLSALGEDPVEICGAVEVKKHNLVFDTPSG